MITRLFLIRHGATALSAEDCFAGSTDVELSDEGRRQAERLSLRLSSQDIKAIYASPMRRTRETAEIIARPHALGLNTDSGLREIDHGRWETRRRADIEAQFPQEYADWEADPFTFAPEGGESGANVIARALPVIRQIVLAHPVEIQ